MQKVESPIDVRELLSVLKRRKWFIIVPTLVVVIIGSAASYTIAPLYESSTLIHVSIPVSLSSKVLRMMGEYRDLVGVMDSRRTNVAELEREMRTPPYVNRIIDLAGLTDDPELNLEAQALQIRYPERSMSEIRVDIVGNQLTGMLELEYVTSSLLSMSIRTDDPYRARDLARSVGAAFMAEKERQTEQAVFRSMNFAYDELAKRESKLQEKVDELAGVEQEIVALESGDAGSQVDPRSDVRMEIDQRKSELRDLRSRAQSEFSALNRLSIDEFRISQSSRLRQQTTELDSLVTSIVSLIKAHPVSHPTVTDIQIRLAMTEDAITKEHTRLVAERYADLSPADQDRVVTLLGLRLRVGFLESYVSLLSDYLQARDTKVQNLPELRSRHQILSQEIVALQRLRDTFKDQQDVFELSLALVQESRYEIVEEPALQLAPVWPDRRIIITVALLAGFIIGGIALFIAEASDRTISSAEAAEAHLGIPVSGVIPPIESLKALTKGS